MDKKKCEKCNAEILVSTYDRNDGLCQPCKTGNRKVEKTGRWYTVIKYFGIFGEITSGIFGAIIGAVIGYAMFGITGAIILGLIGFFLCLG